MIPSPWVGLVLALAVFRACRLIGWDDFPPVMRARGWVTGQHETTSGSANARMGVTGEGVTREIGWRRPLLAHFLGCAYCLGAWLSVAVYAAWLAEPTWTLYGTFPFALSAAVGIIARRGDPE